MQCKDSILNSKEKAFADPNIIKSFNVNSCRIGKKIEDKNKLTKLYCNYMSYFLNFIDNICT